MVNSFTRFVKISFCYVKHAGWFCEIFKGFWNSDSTRFVRYIDVFPDSLSTPAGGGKID
jgi:hypothetical protein